MSYSRIADTFAFAATTLAAGNSAIGAYARYASWVGAEQSDGFVPLGVAAMIGSRKDLDALVREGLLEPVVPGEHRVVRNRVGANKTDVEVVMPAEGFWIPDYLRHNLTAAEGEAHARSLSQKGQKGGLASARSRSSARRLQAQVQPRVQPQVQAEANRPVQSGPVQSRENPAVTSSKEQDPDQSAERRANQTALSEQCSITDGNDAREARGRAVSQCVICDSVYLFDEKGSTGVRCPACVALTDDVISAGEVRELRLMHTLLARSEGVAA